MAPGTYEMPFLDELVSPHYSTPTPPPPERNLETVPIISFAEFVKKSLDRKHSVKELEEGPSSSIKPTPDSEPTGWEWISGVTIVNSTSSRSQVLISGRFA